MNRSTTGESSLPPQACFMLQVCCNTKNVSKRPLTREDLVLEALAHRGRTDLDSLSLPPSILKPGILGAEIVI